MPPRQRSGSNSDGIRRMPASTPEERERQLVNAAYDLAERQIREGTASSQVISHFLKMGSSREQKEQARLGEEVGLLRIKADTIASQKRVEELYTEAMDAFRAYAGQEPINRGDDD